MSVKLLTKHHFEFLSIKGGCTVVSELYAGQNATLLEITCHGSCMFVVAPIVLGWFVFGPCVVLLFFFFF